MLFSNPDVDTCTATDLHKKKYFCREYMVILALTVIWKRWRLFVLKSRKQRSPLRVGKAKINIQRRPETPSADVVYNIFLSCSEQKIYTFSRSLRLTPTK